jgi:replicative DNA helicase
MENQKHANLKKALLPNDFLIEESILNILLTCPDQIKENLGNLNINYFFDEDHRLIYSTIVELAENSNLLNLILIISKLEEKAILKKIGGIQRITKIINRQENPVNLKKYVELVHDKYFRRLILELGKEILNLGGNYNLKLEEILHKIYTLIENLNKKKIKEKIYSSAEIVNDIFNDIQTKKNTGAFSYTTSFKDLDSILQGFQKSDLIIVAGRPSMGKTAFSLNIARNIVEKYKIPIIIFSLEMSRQQIIYRFLSSEAQLNSSRLKTGKMTSLEWENLGKSMKIIAELPIFIDDNPNLTLTDIQIKLKNVLLEKKEIGLIIIDYLQLMKLPVKLGNRTQEVSHLTRNLKILAKEFNIPIILLSQLSRTVESRINKRPMLSDLRESGCIVKTEISKNFQEEFTDLIIQEKNHYSWNLSNLIQNPEIRFELKGIKPTYLITLENQVQIHLTANHRIFSKNGWIKVYQLTEGIEISCLIKKSNSEKFSLENFTKIKKIEYQGTNFVYDKTIPIYHNYFFEGILFHNSIEQDADIVIMLYREDSFQENILGNQIIEFIVAKHRNGPVGTAKLLFSPSITKFLNL